MNFVQWVPRAFHTWCLSICYVPDSVVDIGDKTQATVFAVKERGCVCIGWGKDKIMHLIWDVFPKGLWHTEALVAGRPLDGWVCSLRKRPRQGTSPRWGLQGHRHDCDLEREESLEPSLEEKTVPGKEEPSSVYLEHQNQGVEVSEIDSFPLCVFIIMRLFCLVLLKSLAHINFFHWEWLGMKRTWNREDF